MFSQKSELELLYAKIVTEAPLVKNWVIVEGAYSFKGEKKPLILQELLSKDSRFIEYSKRIHVVEVHQNLISDFRYGATYFLRKKLEIIIRKFISRGYEHEKRIFLEKKHFHAEWISRDSAIPKILELSTSGNDWILISDVDEILNLSDKSIYNSISQIMESNEMFHMLYRQRFVFDFDNYDYQQRFTPFINIELLKSSCNLSPFRGRIDGIAQNKYPFVTEYSYCFDLQPMLTKLKMFSHISPTKEKVIDALRLNCHLMYSDSNKLDTRLYKKVDLNDYLIPKYIKDNFDKLKTNNIDLNYESNRKAAYPEVFKKAE